MIEVIFSVDYEIYGNGEGSLWELVYEPTEGLRNIFKKRNARFVVFAEIAELEMIEACGAYPEIEILKQQLRDLHREGFEIGLHIHPWWYSARRENKGWEFDFSEYNLCTQSQNRINQIIDRAIDRLRATIANPDFFPTSYRAGHLLFQPTLPLSNVLAKKGIKLDSSVYKGGRWRQHKVDYRRAPKDELYWKFTHEITKPEPDGALLEIPIYTEMVPIWKLFTSKRVHLQKVGLTHKQTARKISKRICDVMRFRYPKKFDLGQMTKHEMVHMMDRIIKEDGKNPSAFHPVVVIMHTKDPIDFDAVDSLLAYLEKKRIKISTFSDVYEKIMGLHGARKNN